jgi:hypothetical protein
MPPPRTASRPLGSGKALPCVFHRRRNCPVSSIADEEVRSPFVKVPLWWIEAAAKATDSPTTIVLVTFLRLARALASNSRKGVREIMGG